MRAGSGRFLVGDTTPDAVFTREDLSEEQLLFGRAAEEFMRTEVVPRAAEIYAKDWPLTRELIKKAADRDFTRLEIPEAYGGLGLDKVSTACVGEQLGLLPSFAGSLGAHTSIGTLPIVYFGNDEQRQRYLPRLANGELIGAFALTEPEAGSDALSARTTATLTPDGRHYSLRGQKLWITNGGFADIFTVFAKIDGKHFTAFIVERGMGVISGAEEHKLGLDGNSTTALMFDDVQGAGRECAGHRRRRTQGRVQHPEPGPRQARDAEHRRRQAGADRRREIRDWPQAVRQVDRQLRDDQAQDRRDVGALLRRRRDGVPFARRSRRGVEPGRRQRRRRGAEGDRRVRHRMFDQQGVEQRSARVCRGRSAAGLRRQRLLARVPGGARLP